MQKGSYNEEQQAFIDKLLATFTREELRLLPQTFESWHEDSEYELSTYYETTEVFNMGIAHVLILQSRNDNLHDR